MWASQNTMNETTNEIQARVLKCRQLQITRQGKANGHLSSNEVRTHCQLSYQNNELLELAVEKLGLSTRAHHKILKIARTLADIDNTEDIVHKHIIEALSYRAMDRIFQYLTASIAL